MPQKGRSFKNFNQNEFKNELSAIDWESLLSNTNNGNACFKIFFDKIESLLNEMAPIKILSKREQTLKRKPWLTVGILKSIRSRDILHKEYLKEKNAVKKQIFLKKYKLKRNLIMNLTSISKENILPVTFHG